MKVLERLRKTEKVTDMCIDDLVEKARASQRRKWRFNHNGHNGKRAHWVNHTGTYQDEESRKGPKYWNGHKPVLVHNPIKSYQDLATAIGLIASGDKNYTDYAGVTGINRDRLRLAQSWRDSNRNYDVSGIVKLSSQEIKIELGFGKANYGRVYRHKIQFF
ncbi:hypothetical protein HYV80_05360 [Candidatus Woesearchaeota archaeon]|nr:hypothetical protein [Candidatus Woesearchaeota archaeon]